VNTKTVQAHGCKFIVRTDHHFDEAVIRESHYEKMFKAGRFTSGDRWLDAGANIGTFTARYAPIVDFIVAVEPDADNFELLYKNCLLNKVDVEMDESADEPDAYLIQAALVADDRQTVQLARTRSPLMHRVSDRPIRGREFIDVQAVSVHDLVKRFGLNKLKLDCETMEKPVLETVDLDPVDEIVYEWHFRELRDLDQVAYTAAWNRLTSAGFTVEGPEPGSRKGKRWYAMVHAWRA
jgi:FkbM family methyltransferase